MWRQFEKKISFHEFVLFCGSLTTYLSHLLPSAMIVETKQNYRLGKLRFVILDRACGKHEQ